MPVPYDLSQLPLEVLFWICRYLDVSDVLRVRRVSRYLNEVTYCRDVWAAAHQGADFVRLPGPFPSQSARDLENALVLGFRMDQSLRNSDAVAESERSACKLIEVQFNGTQSRIRFVFGRFLLTAFADEIRCYDVNADASGDNPSANIIYRPTQGTIKSFFCASATDGKGSPFACIVLEEGARDQGQVSIYLLNIAKQHGLTPVLIYRSEHRMFNIRRIDLGPRAIIVHGSMGRTPDNGSRIIALEVHTRTQLLFPPIDAIWKTDDIPEDMGWISSMSTSTHILLSRPVNIRGTWNTIINAFALPIANAHVDSTPLSHSHHGIIPRTTPRRPVLLHDTVVDASTQDILFNIRLQVLEPYLRRLVHFTKHGTLRLDGSSHGRIGTITFEAIGPLGHLSRHIIDRPSLNGMGRSFYMVPGYRPLTVAAFEYNVRRDANGKGEQEAKSREYPSILRFHTPRTLVDYDFYHGRICVQSNTGKGGVIEVWDLSR